MEFLQQAMGTTQHLPLSVVSIRLGAAFLYGLLAVLIYVISCRRGDRKADQSFLATLVLLSFLIAMVTMVIGDNVARAFSLVGTLAIVRFRTVVEDTRDTAFVIYTVVCGMCAGSGYFVGPLACAPLVLLATWMFARREKKKKDRENLPPGRMVLRLSSAMNVEGAFKATLDQHLPGHQLVGMTTARGGSAWDATYAIEFPEPAQVYQLISVLSAIDGVQGVELTND